MATKKKRRSSPKRSAKKSPTRSTKKSRAKPKRSSKQAVNHSSPWWTIGPPAAGTHNSLPKGKRVYFSPHYNTKIEGLTGGEEGTVTGGHDEVAEVTFDNGRRSTVRLAHLVVIAEDWNLSPSERRNGKVVESRRPRTNPTTKKRRSSPKRSAKYEVSYGGDDGNSKILIEGRYATMPEARAAERRLVKKIERGDIPEDYAIWIDPIRPRTNPRSSSLVDSWWAR